MFTYYVENNEKIKGRLYNISDSSIQLQQFHSFEEIKKEKKASKKFRLEYRSSKDVRYLQKEIIGTKINSQQITSTTYITNRLNIA